MVVAPGNQTILVVDDDALALDGLMEVLQNHGYQVRQAHDGREALDAAKNPPAPSLILLDLSMPVMDGWEFLRQQRLELHLPYSSGGG
jgi:CheY-like chemotaxis protein